MTTMRPALAAFAVALLAGAVAPAADAQRVPQIQVGQTVTGSLSGDDPVFQLRGAFKVHSFEAQEGQRFVANLRSTDFDAFLSLLRPVGPLTETLRTDDDGGAGNDARMRFTVPVTGTYYLVAQAFSAGSYGDYSLTLEIDAPPPALPRPIAVGETRREMLTVNDPILNDDGDWEYFYHLYTVEASEGQTLLITMDSDDFDSYLMFGPMRDGVVRVTDIDDDGGDGPNARLLVTVPQAGTYGIRARSYGPGRTGAYTLTVREMAH